MTADALSARERHRLEVAARDPYECALAHEGPCEAPFQADHIIRVQVLEARHRTLRLWIDRGRPLLTPGELRFAMLPFDELAADARNGWLLCSFVHTLKDRKLLRVDPAVLPVEFELYVAEHDLAHVRDRELRPPEPRRSLDGATSHRRHGGRP